MRVRLTVISTPLLTGAHLCFATEARVPVCVYVVRLPVRLASQGDQIASGRYARGTNQSHHAQTE